MLNNKNIYFYSFKHYKNVISTTPEEIKKDFHIPQTLSKYFHKTKTNGAIKDRQILNILITFFNIFEETAATRILFFQIKSEYHSLLKTYLLFLNKCPSIIKLIPFDIDLNQLEVHEDILKRLRY